MIKHPITSAVLAGLLIGPLAAPAGGAEAIRHGVPAPVSESRGAIASADGRGRPIILVMTPNRATAQFDAGVLLMIDARTGTVEHIPYPDRAPVNQSNFGLMVASTGKLYTGFGPLLAAFDPDRGAFTWTKRLDPDPGHALAWTEGPDGTIYAGFFNTCSVVALDPATHEIRDLGQLDANEKFVYTLFTDDAGWLYAGIGNARSNLVAVHLSSGERRQLIPDDERQRGTGILRRGEDGHVDGRSNSRSEQWLRLHDGAAEPIEGEPAIRQVPAMAWQKVYPHFPDGSRLADFDLPNTSYTLISPDGESKRMTFDYTGCGAPITAMNGAPDGRVYGSTSHPFRWFAVDTATDELIDFGGLQGVGGGNVRGMVWHDGIVYGADYSGGRFWAFDTSKPWNDTGRDEDGNPRALGAFADDLGRPRTMMRHPQDQTIIWSGMAGYGYPFGGMGFYDTDRDEITILKNERLVRGLSCITLRDLPDGDLVGGTTVTAGFGHDAAAEAAEIFIMDYTRREVTFHTAPVPGARSIQCVAVGEDGLVYGVTSAGDLFVFDPSSQTVRGRSTVAEYGRALQPDQSLFRHGERMYALRGDALLSVTFSQSELRVSKVSDLPASATAGTAVMNGRVYYAAGVEVWSVPLPNP